jgi:hypothetical protein
MCKTSLNKISFMAKAVVLIFQIVPNIVPGTILRHTGLLIGFVSIFLWRCLEESLGTKTRVLWQWRVTKQTKKQAVSWPVKLSVPCAAFKNCVKKHEKSAQDKAETRLRNQLLLVRNTRNEAPHDRIFTRRKLCPYVSKDDDGKDEGTKCPYCNGNFSQGKKGDKLIRCSKCFP